MVDIGAENYWQSISILKAMHKAEIREAECPLGVSHLLIYIFASES